MKKTIIILLIIGLMVAAAGCASTDGSGVQNVKASDDTSKVENAEAKEQTTPPVKGSFNNPAAIGETVVLASTGDTYEVSVLDVKRGEQALYVIKSADDYTQKIPTGYEFILVKTRVAYTKGNSPSNIGYLDFKAFSEGVEREISYETLPRDYIKFDSGDVMPGATKEGWLQYTVPQSTDVILSFQPNMFEESTGYISLGK